MQNFAQKKIAVAVGAGLLAMAGVAQAAAPALRGTAPAVVHSVASAAGQAADSTFIRSLLSANGLSGQTLTVSVNLTSAVTTAGITGDINVVQGSVLAVPNSGAAVTLDVNGGTLADIANNVNVYTGTLSAATALPVTSATFVNDPQATLSSGKASVTVLLAAPGGAAAYRINAGNLEYTSNNGTTGGTAVAWAPVNIDVTSSAAGATGATDRIIYTEEGTAAGYVNATDLVPGTLTVTGTIKNGLAPTPTIATRSTAGAALIDGVVLDLGTPATVAANLLVSTMTAGAVVGGTDITAKMTGTGSTSTATKTLTFTAPGTAGATGIGWISGSATATTADAAAYAPASFNTGVTGASVPVSVDGTATASAYTEVYNNGDGTFSKLDNSAGASKAVTAAALTAAGVARACVADQGVALIAAGNTVTDTAAASKAAIAAFAAPILNTPATCTTAAAVTAGVTADTAIKAAVAALGGTADLAGETLVIAGATAAVSVQDVAQDAAVLTATVADAAFPAKFADPVTNIITDGAAPAFVSATSVGTSTLELLFSEPLETIGGAVTGGDILTPANATTYGDLRELAENIKLGSDTLAALTLNAGGDVGASLTVAGSQGKLILTGIATADLAKQVSVTKGISVQENDENPTATDIIETTAGLTTVNGAAGATTGSVEILTAAASNITPTPPVLLWTNAADSGIRLSAVDAGGANAGKIAKLTVTFDKAVKLGAGKSMPNVATNLVVAITGAGAQGANDPITFNVYPTSAELTDMATGGTTMDITLPTDRKSVV